MKTETQPPRLGDILKSEADSNSRDYIKADNVKIGNVVDYGKGDNKRKLIALSNSEHGKVLVQPFNCVINLAVLEQEKIKPQLQELLTIGEKFGIKYVEEIAVNSDSSSTNTATTTAEDNTATTAEDNTATTAEDNTATTAEDNSSATTEATSDPQSQPKTKELWASKWRNPPSEPVNEDSGIYFFGDDKNSSNYASKDFYGGAINVVRDLRGLLVDDISPFTEDDFWSLPA